MNEFLFIHKLTHQTPAVKPEMFGFDNASTYQFTGEFEGAPSCLPSNFFTSDKIEAEFEGAPSCLPSNFHQTRKELSHIFSEELFLPKTRNSVFLEI